MSTNFRSKKYFGLNFFATKLFFDTICLLQDSIIFLLEYWPDAENLKVAFRDLEGFLMFSGRCQGCQEGVMMVTMQSERCLMYFCPY